jgi:hypothetical protein
VTRAVLVAAIAALLCSAPGGAERAPLRILFVGNSLTATNDLPGVVAAIGRANGVTVRTQTFAPGGFALEDHWSAGVARDALASGGWDYVVMQQGPSSLPDSRVNLIEWARTWSDLARAHGTTPVLLTVWPEQYRSAYFGAVIRNYHDAAARAHALLAPAGVAWRNALHARPAPRLYGPDGFHPSALGTYVAALTVYARLTGAVPRVTGLDARTATVVRRAVSAALR